ncbi:MAG TPA: hypothetical protein DCR40_20295 [Prolixibacteraceae bacterium]|nr:hypothetical protein [Prolixibacteraceae bacterium]
MENVKFQILANEQGLITNLSMSGLLVVENAQQLKKELVGTLNRLCDSVEINIGEVDDIDLSFIQLIVAYTKQLDGKGNKFRLNWNLDDDQRLLFKNVGLSDELFMNY